MSGVFHVEAGMDVFSPLADADLHAAPRAGLALGLVMSNGFSLLAEGSLVWLPAAADEPAWQENLAFTLRLLLPVVQPALSLSVPTWDDETGWVMALDLQIGSFRKETW